MDLARARNSRPLRHRPGLPSRFLPCFTGPRPLGDSEAEEPEDAEAPSGEDLAAALLEDELAGPGPCIQVEVTARGAPVPNAQVHALRAAAEDIYYELSPLPVGPEGRRQGWCKPGEYRLAALAPGFAPSLVKLTVKEGGAPPTARFELASGHTLSGRVLDKDSEQPIPGTQLRVQLLDEDLSSLVPELSALSDAQGLFRLGALAQGTYQIELTAPGHTSHSIEVEVPAPGSLTLELEGTSRIEGQVVDGAGAPVPGAKMWIGSSGHLSDEAEEKTDAQGHFSLEVSEGSYLVAASAGGLSGVHEGLVSVARGGLVDGLVIRLSPTGTLTGRAIVHSSQEPVRNAYLVLRQADSGWDHSTQTLEDGTFRMENLAPGPYSVMLFKSGFNNLRREDVLIQPGQEAKVELALIREARVEGTVMDALGRPAEEAILVATPLQEAPDTLFVTPLQEVLGALSRRRGAHGAPDDSGHYQIAGLFPGRYRVEARLTWESKPLSQEVTLQEGGSAHADFVLTEALGQVDGTVQRASGGPPVHAVDIQATLGTVSTQASEVDEQGHFTLKLSPGEYTFIASYSETQEEGPPRTVRVEAGKVAHVTLSVPNAVAETSGVVLNARGEPVAEAEVSLEDGDELSSQADTDSAGRFTLKTPLSSVGKTVSVSARNGAEQGSLKNVRVGSRNVVVRLQKASGLRGRIVTALGGPVQSFELRVLQLAEEDSDSVELGERPFVGDTFEWVDLPPGTMELRARTSDGRSGKVKVQLAAGHTATVELPVGTLGSITGRVVNFSNAPTPRWVSVDEDTPGEQQAVLSDEGRFELSALEPGKHQLRIGNTQHLLLELRAGEVLDVGTVDLMTGPMTPR